MSKDIWIPERGNIIWIDFNPQKGREIRDIHPMLVLSPKNFNLRTGIVIGLPMTTAEYNASNPFSIEYQGLKAIKSYILTHQPKSFDWRQRKAKLHPLKKVPEDVLSNACELLNQIITLVE
ncbi:MAG: type II toxin-antitoxin system PemK/MazF family toxin [Candidatus Protochlamydia sp.]|nr:type II toxin-antitoxin system PemK/MazF family toxin [Candidatus Protochlamydia sp.]